jgi:hypothetical protein
VIVIDEDDFASMGVKFSCDERVDEELVDAKGICTLDWEAGAEEGCF